MKKISSQLAKALCIPTLIAVKLIAVTFILVSCSKSSVAPAKTYSSIVGSWSIDQPTINYSATFDIVQGDSKYPFYPSNIKGSWNGKSFSYTGITASQGLILNPNKTMSMLLQATTGIVFIAGMVPNAAYNQITATNGYIDVNANDTYFANPIVFTRVK